MLTAEFTIRKIGNSFGAIFPAEILKALKIAGTGSKLEIFVNDNGTAVLKAKDVPMDSEGPFKDLNVYASAWDGSEKTAMEMAEELKSGRKNKVLLDNSLDSLW